MSQNLGECPVCHKNIQQGEDTVVCPDCGTPYHRACWQQTGHCVYSDKHGTGFEYKAPQAQPTQAASPGNTQQAAEGAATVVCPRCHAQNSARNIFCERCGNALHGQPSQPNNANNSRPYGGMPYYTNNDTNGPTPPYGFAVDLNGEIDGISKKDWNTFIGTSQAAYLPRLIQQETRNTKLGGFFSAFFVPQYYFAYRKMWGWAGLLTVLSVLQSLPSLFMLMLSSGHTVFGLTVDTLYSLNNVTYILGWAIRIACGVFSLWLYRQHAGKKIKALRIKYPEENTYQAELQKNGGTSWAGVLLVTAVIFVVCAFCTQFISVDVLWQYLYY